MFKWGQNHNNKSLGSTQYISVPSDTTVLLRCKEILVGIDFQSNGMTKMKEVNIEYRKFFF